MLTHTAAEPRIGETFVQGKDRETARALLDAADRLGVEHIEVKTVNRGFIVPNAVWDDVQQHRQAEQGLDF